MKSTIQQELLILCKTIIIEPHITHIFGKYIKYFNSTSIRRFLATLHLLINTSSNPSKDTIDLLLQMIKDITPGKYKSFVFYE